MWMFWQVVLCFTLVIGEPTDITSDREALVNLYNSTAGDHWTNSSNWLIGDPCDNDWFGVVCNDLGVTALTLGTNNLNGTIPESLSMMTNLKNL
jgi:hypothetical protein